MTFNELLNSDILKDVLDNPNSGAIDKPCGESVRRLSQNMLLNGT